MAKAGNRTRTATSGSFKPGQSGNPSGRPKSDIRLKELAKEHTEAAIATLVKGLTFKGERSRIAAAEALLDRGWGKASQHIELDAGDELVKRMNEAAKKLHGDAG